MYAIVETGGKQFRVWEGTKIIVEKLAGEPGAEVVLDKVLLVAGDECKIGTPYVDAAKVTAEIVAQRRQPKVIVFKRRRRKDSKTKHGHRQYCTELRVKGISVGDAKGAADNTRAESPKAGSGVGEAAADSAQ